MSLDDAEIRRRLAATSLATPAAAGDLPTGNLLAPGPAPELPQALVPASVLVAIVLAPEPGILLTRRHAQLRRHAGQVSFPGGRNNPCDRDAEAAALRKSWEEIGLPPHSVELVGRLDDQPTGTGFLITPVLGLVHALPTLISSPDEADAIFQLPLLVLLDPAAPRRRRQELAGRMREVWVWPHPEHDVMGVTAAILVQLARRLHPP